MTCDELARIWPEKFPRPDAENTEQNARMVKKWGHDFAGRDPNTISREEALDWSLANLAAARYVRTMLNDFQSIGLVEDNVWSCLKLPPRSKELIVVPRTAQVDELIQCARAKGDHYLASAIEFSAFVGLRYSEQRAVLRPGELGSAMGNAFVDTLGQRIAIDSPLERRRLRIDWQMGRKARRLKRPKTKRSVRNAMVARRAQHAVAEALNHHGGESAFLWPLGRAAHMERWSDLRREVGIWFKWHNLRHHCATWLLDNGATTDDVAVQLGCREEEVRKTYGHPDAEKALTRLEGLVDA